MMLLKAKFMSMATLARARFGILAQSHCYGQSGCPHFNTTVWENIAYGRLDATKRKLSLTSKCQRIYLQSPQGYDTQVGDRGVRLSESVFLLLVPFYVIQNFDS